LLTSKTFSETATIQSAYRNYSKRAFCVFWWRY